MRFVSRLQGGGTFYKAEATPTTAPPTAARTLTGQTVLGDMAAAATLCLTSARLDLRNRRMAPSTKTTGVCCSAEAMMYRQICLDGQLWTAAGPDLCATVLNRQLDIKMKDLDAKGKGSLIALTHRHENCNLFYM